MSTTASNNKSIALLGLGIMGRAVAKAYSNKGYTVHGWSRSKAKRELAEQTIEKNIVVYDHPAKAIRGSTTSDLVLMMVMPDEMLGTANNIIQSIDPETWKEKVLVQFTSHEPFSIKAQEKLMESLQARLIGGAMMAAPKAVGSSGIFLVSSSAKTEPILQQHLSTLQVLGTIVRFEGDIGYAALADIGLLQGMQFGLAGNELSCLIFKRYGVDQKFQKTYLELLPKTTVPLIKDLAPLSCQAVFSGDYRGQSKVYAAVGHRAMYEAHQYFFQRMGLQGPTYLSVYLKQFQKVQGSDGPSAIVDHYSFSSS